VSGRPSPMNLSEEGSLVYWIAINATIRSIFLQGNAVEGKAKPGTSCCAIAGDVSTGTFNINASSYGGTALLPSRHRHHHGARTRVWQNDFAAHDVHGIKLVAGPLGQFVHMVVCALQPNHASAPEGRSIREFFEQIVMMLHGSPLSAARQFTNILFPCGKDVQFIELMASIRFASFRQGRDGAGRRAVMRGYWACAGE
jgi:hypothetical protein